MRGAPTRFGVTAMALALSLAVAAVGTVVAQDEPVTLTFQVPDVTLDATQPYVDAYMAANPNVNIELDIVPGGTDGDNLVKTRLATGEMPDVFLYNSGSLFQALNPTETLVDLSGEDYIGNIADSFLTTVSAGEGGLYGVPIGTAQGGGILYNIPIYEELGLEIPTTWEEFAANNEVIKEAGIAPVGQTYGSTWTSQLFVLGDYYNVQAADPDFAEKYTNNQAKFVDTPAALAGFQHLQEGFDKGWYQEDFGSAIFEDGLRMVAEGEIAHYPMLTGALPTIAANNPDQINDVGFFAQPGAEGANGATVWMPNAVYIPQTTENVDAAKDFLAYIASIEGTEAATAAIPPAGPYVILGSVLPEDTVQAAKDLDAYIQSGDASPALEFVSPVKGPSLENITVAVGSGLNTAEEGAALYDQDVEKQAQQLGLPGW